MDINYHSRGGQYPYQAEGIIDSKYHFYFRSRHGYCRLELALKEVDVISDNTCDIGYKFNELLNNKSAHKIIEKLYKSLKPFLEQ